MSEIVIIINCISVLILAKIGLNIKFKNLKKLNIRTNNNARKIAEKLPDDEKICKDILKMLDNNSAVKIVHNEEYNCCLYTVYNNTITIGKFKETYIKPQTIAHECVHACQNRKKLWFNFIISNILNLYFTITLFLSIINKLPYSNIFLLVLISLAFIQYIVRNDLEMEAMTKAPYITKEYLISKNILTDEEIKQLINEFDEINKIGIPFTNYSFILKNTIKIIILCITIFI